MWPLSSPVAFHWAMNSFCDRLPISAVTSIETGMVTRAIRASSGETTNIIDHHADHREQRREQLAQRLLQGLGDVVDVVGHPAQQLTAGLPVEVAQRQPVDLGLDLVAQRVDRALHRAVEQVALQPHEQRATARTGRARPAGTGRAGSKSMPWPGTTSSRCDQVGERVVALGAELRRPPAPWWPRPAGSCRSTPVKMTSVARPRMQRADDVERRCRSRPGTTHADRAPAARARDGRAAA